MHNEIPRDCFASVWCRESCTCTYVGLVLAWLGSQSVALITGKEKTDSSMNSGGFHMLRCTCMHTTGTGRL